MNSEVSRFVEEVRKSSPLSAAYLTALTETPSLLERKAVPSAGKSARSTLEKQGSRHSSAPLDGGSKLGKNKSRNAQSRKIKSSVHPAAATTTKAPASKAPKAGKPSRAEVVGQLPTVQVKSKKLMALLEKVSSRIDGNCENRSLHSGECCVCRFFKYKGNEKGIIRRSSYVILLRLHSSHDSVVAKLKLVQSWLNKLEKQGGESGDGERAEAMETSVPQRTSKSSTSNGLAHEHLPTLGSTEGASDEEPTSKRPSRRQRHAQKEKDLVRLKAEADLVDLELRTKKQSALTAHKDALQQLGNSDYRNKQSEKRLEELVACKLRKRQLDKQMRGQLKRHKSGAKK